jgi:hypothetical protein
VNAEDFAPHVDTPFAVGELETTLVEVRQLDVQDPEFRQPFTLSFRGPREPILPQGTYELSHAELGTLEIFIVPVASNEAGTTYEAVFN